MLTNSEKCDINKSKELTEAQLDFLEVCQQLGWGKIELTVQNGEPAYSRVIEHTHQHKKPNNL